ncbi:YcxB family protein [Devosia insulae]|nr:YcxB family protein [Devosia insulae]
MSFHYVPDYREVAAAHNRMRKSLLRPLDYLVRWAIVPYYAAVIVIATLISGYVGSLWRGADMVTMIATLLAAYYLWEKVFRRRCLGYFIRRLQRFEPVRSTTVAVDERGLTHSDEFSSHWLDWRTVRAAELTKEGILVTFGAQGLLVPNRAFPDLDARDSFVELVNRSARAEQV